MTILIVDDDLAIREMLMQTFEDEGYSVAVAADGLEALEYLTHNVGQARLIVLDLMMPRMNGWEFLQARKQYPELVSIPVIVLSARNDLEQQVGKADIATYLAKPCSIDRLLEIVQQTYTTTDAA